MSDLSTSTKFSYCFGQLAEGIKTSSFSLFLLFFYNQVLGVSGSLCALAMVIAMCVDAITDPLVGSLSDNWRSRLGRRHPFMYAASIPLAVGYYFLFNPQVSGEFELFLWMLIVSIVLRFMLTLYHVPHLALGAELTNDYHQRTSLVAYRQVFGSLGYILVYALGFGVFFVSTDSFSNGQLNRDAYAPFAGLLAAIMFTSVAVMSLGTQKAAQSLPRNENDPSMHWSTPFMDVAEAMRSRSFQSLVAGFIVISVPIGIGMALGLYLNTYFWQVKSSHMIYVLVALPLGTIVGYGLAATLAKHIEKKQAVLWGATGWCFFAATPVGLHYAGLFPTLGTTANLVGLVVAQFAAGLAISQLIVAINSMLADIADEHELETGKRTEGVFFGAYAFVIKATAGIGAAASGLVLDLINWPAGEHIRSAADVPQESLLALSIVAGPAFAIGLLPALWLFAQYQLSHARHAEILSQLNS